MTTIEQLLREALTAGTEDVPQLRSGAARSALRSNHRRSRVRLAALSTAIVLATVGVGAYAVSRQPATDVGPSRGPRPSAAVPHPVYSGFRGVGDSAPGPADLVAVTLPDSVPAAQLVPGSETYSRDAGHWTKYIQLSRPGIDRFLGVVLVTKASVKPPLNPSLPSPAAKTLTVTGRPATEWVSGGDHWVFFTAGQFTVEVYASDKAFTTPQMVAVADALQGLPK